ncbi:hypothetical protein F5880DRAFT_1509601 [Lentinula raphanica]|nr:hypothetical protein F5880DRAFT_1509601 [Lentinula raphanica]
MTHFFSSRYKQADMEVPGPSQQSILSSPNTSRQTWRYLMSIYLYNLHLKCFIQFLTTTHSFFTWYKQAGMEFKKDFKKVKELQEKSGFRWDAARNVATAEEDVWEKLLQIATRSTAFHPGDAHNTLLKAVGNDDDDDGDGEDKDDQTVPQTPAPARRLLAPTSSSDSISTNIKKRTAATPDSSERPRYEVADTLRDLAHSAAGEAIDPSMQSPEDGELSENEMMEAFKLICRQTKIEDAHFGSQN